jgi:hypothetical protein
MGSGFDVLAGCLVIVQPKLGGAQAVEAVREVGMVFGPDLAADGQRFLEVPACYLVFLEMQLENAQFVGAGRDVRVVRGQGLAPAGQGLLVGLTLRGISTDYTLAKFRT